MGRFAFEARTASGATLRGIEIASDESDLDRRLADDDLLLIRAKPVTRGRVKTSSSRAMVDFCYHLAIVLEAGIPLLEGLRDLANSDHPLRDTIGDVSRKIESGASLSGALDDYPQLFPELVRGLIRAGEEGGSLARVLRDLVRFLEWREDLRRQLMSAATYPALVLTGIAALCVMLTTFVLPRFLEIFDEVGAALPPTTRALMGMHGFLVQFWPMIMLGSLGAAILAAVLLGRPPIRLRVDRFLLRLPLLGSLAMMIEMSRFAHNLQVMLSSGVPMIRSLEMVTGVVQNRAIREAIAKASELVEQGGSLTESLARSELLPSLVLRMLSVGETSGQLEEALARISEYYDREVPLIVSRAVTFFNTATLLTLGLVLVVVVLSIFTPLYSMMGDLSAAH